MKHTMVWRIGVFVLVCLTGAGLNGGVWACPPWPAGPGAVRAEASLAAGGACSSVAEWEAARVFGFGHILHMAYSPDGKRLALATRLGVVVWNNEQAVIERVLMGPVASTSSVAWSPDGRWVASGSWDRTVKVWDAETGELRWTLLGHTWFVKAVGWSPDSQRVVSGSGDSTVKVWDAERGTLLLTLETGVDMESVAWSPDSRQLAGAAGGPPGDGDHTIKVWQADTGELLGTLRGHARAVGVVAWSPDGEHLLSGSEDGTLRIWGCPPVGRVGPDRPAASRA